MQRQAAMPYCKVWKVHWVASGEEQTECEGEERGKGGAIGEDFSIFIFASTSLPVLILPLESTYILVP